LKFDYTFMEELFCLWEIFDVRSMGDLAKKDLGKNLEANSIPIGS